MQVNAINMPIKEKKCKTHVNLSPTRILGAVNVLRRKLVQAELKVMLAWSLTRRSLIYPTTAFKKLIF